VRRLAAGAAFVAIVWLAGPQPASAQGFDWPTLEELGVRYVSPDGLVQVTPSVRVDVDGFFPQDAPAWHLEDTSPFIAGRASLFLDLFVGRRLFVSTEVRLDRGQPARSGPVKGHLQQAFVRWTPAPGTNVHVQGGKFVSPFGGYPGRAHTSADPFIRPPLAYDHRTVMQPVEVPAAPDGVFTWKNRPAFRAAGLPIVWAVPYPIGLTVSGGKGPISATGGVTTTAPSAEPSDWDTFDTDDPAGPAAVAQVRYRVSPALHVAASYTNGPYMRSSVIDPVSGVRVPKQDQEAFGVDATFSRGLVDIRGELLVNRWEVFRAPGDPRDVSYYVEGQARVAAGLFVAARYNAIHFRDLPRSNGQPDRWDYDMRRWQFGTGYRLGRRSEIRAEYMINTTVGRDDPRDDLLSVQWWLAF
jgi:hypothetical protein